MEDVGEEMDREFRGKVNNNKKNEKENFMNGFVGGRNRMVWRKMGDYDGCEGGRFGKILGIWLDE